ncbi:MAG: 50S ribosomal protein L17 [Candidatus Kuenenbacteria bacterium]
MRHRSSKKILDRNYKQRKALLGNLATSLVLHEKIKTTEAKAKVLRPKLEKMISRSKVNSLHNRRVLMKHLMTKGAVDKMLEVIGPKYKDRRGGYLRIVKLGKRKGDGAEMCVAAFV